MTSAATKSDGWKVRRDPHVPIWYSTLFPTLQRMRASGASSGDAPPPPRSPAADRSSYPLGFSIWYLDLLLLVLLVFACQFVPRISLIFLVIDCDLVASMGVLRL